jgi:hypothetical protein
MLTPDTLSLLKDTLASAQNILIFLPPKVKNDQLASGLSLFLGIQSLGKNVTILSPEPIGDLGQGLAGKEKITSQMGNQNLQVSFDYNEDQVDKVSYHIDEETKKFHLIIQPKKSVSPIDASKVEFQYTGASADLIFCVGVRQLEDLDGLYYGFEEVFKDATTVSIHSFETDFGSIKVSTAGSASFAEVIAYLLQEMGTSMSDDIASNLLFGIEEATDSFHSLATTADTFEIVSKLLRLGARRGTRARSGKQNNFAQAFGKAQSSSPQIHTSILSEKDVLDRGEKDSSIHPNANPKKESNKKKIQFPSEQSPIEGGSRA